MSTPRFDLHTAPTPNGHKVSIMLEELGVPYTVHTVNLGSGQQKTPAYLKINPNGRIPTLVDHANDDFAIFESGAILMYLGEEFGQLLPSERRGRSQVLQWLMFQMSGIGPMQGQANVFYRYFPEKIQPVIDRYHNETLRLYRVLDKQLQGRDYLCGDYSIADIANFTWVNIHDWAGLSLDGLPNLAAWRERIRARPAVQRGLAVPGDIAAAELVKTAQTILTR